MTCNVKITSMGALRVRIRTIRCAGVDIWVWNKVSIRIRGHAKVRLSFTPIHYVFVGGILALLPIAS